MMNSDGQRNTRVCNGFELELGLIVKPNDLKVVPMHAQNLDNVHKVSNVKERMTCVRPTVRWTNSHSWDSCEFESRKEESRGGRREYMNPVQTTGVCNHPEIFPTDIGIVFAAAMFRILLKITQQFEKDLRDAATKSTSNEEYSLWVQRSLGQSEGLWVRRVVLRGYDATVLVCSFGIKWRPHGGTGISLDVDAENPVVTLELSEGARPTAETINKEIRKDGNLSGRWDLLRTRVINLLLSPSPSASIQFYLDGTVTEPLLRDNQIIKRDNTATHTVSLDLRLVRRYVSVPKFLAAGTAVAGGVTAMGLGLKEVTRRRSQNTGLDEEPLDASTPTPRLSSIVAGLASVISATQKGQYSPWDNWGSVKFHAED